MLTPAGRGTSTSTSSKPHLSVSTPVREPETRVRVDGPATIPGPHFRRLPERGVAGAVLPSEVTLGFLTIVEIADKGFVGGYLLTNVWGRPLEFQCTAPVKPSRAQEILYGPTLRPVLFGELIAATLIEKAAGEPALVLTDEETALGARPEVKVPVVCLDRDALDPAGVHEGTATAAACNAPLARLQDVRGRARCHGKFQDDLRWLDALLRSNECLEDLHEPFQRIHLCIGEVYP